MSTTMARQVGRVQLEQSDMCLVLNMAKMANRGFSCTAIEESQHQIKTHRPEVKEDIMQAAEFPRHKYGKAAIQRHPGMFQENHSGFCLPCQNGTAKDPQTHSRRKGTGEPPPELAPSPPRVQPVPPGANQGAPSYQIDGAPPRYVYIHTPHPNAQFFNQDAYAKDCKRDTDIMPDVLTDEGTSIG